ncbi:MAG: tetratricopeptide repeat protein [Polyangiaceae bacterium]|nr:tetratricopeptide repeat protein [Polyangiaceae bacterium]MCW5791940.1 tetratricopeptide repeat protein [Polyangiaceae bacterium]
MDSNTIRTALGQLQDDPELQSAWEALSAALKAPPGDLEQGELVRLLDAARQRHEERGEWRAAATLLELSTDLVSEEDEITRQRELATLRGDRLLDEEGFELALLRVLELAPEDAAAQAALSESEGKRGRAAELTASYLAEAENAPDEVYQSSMLMRASEVELRYGGESLNLGAAIERLDQAARLDATNLRAAWLLELALRRAEKWEGLDAALARVLDRGGEVKAQVAAGIRLARLRLKQGAPDRAAKAFERTLALEPSRGEARSFLAEHYSNEERWDALVQMYERELDSAALEAADRLGDMLQIAMLHWKKRERASDAEPWFERIRRLEPANPLCLTFFREYAEAEGDEGRLYSVLQAAQRVMTEGPEKSEVTAQLARLAESQQDAQRAIEQYKGVLRQDPANTEAREALKRLYRKTEGHNALVELLRQELERVDAEDADARLALLREVASIYRQFIKSETALVTVLTQITQLAPEDPAPVRELVTLYEGLGRWRDLLTQQQRLAELTEDPTERAEILRGVARRWLDQFSNVQNATEAYQRLLEAAPTDAEALERLEELFKKRRAWASLYDLYAGQLEGAEPSRRLSLQREMARLAAERLQRPDEAIQLYQHILEEDPADRATLDQLERQSERSKNWPVLAGALERRATLQAEEGADEKERLTVLQKLGAVYGDQLSDFDGAARAWRRVLEIQPGNSRALRTLRDAYIERRDYEALEQLYAAQDDFEALADVLSSAADKAKDPETKVDLSYRAAQVYEERLSQPDRAFRSYERVLSVNPTDARAAGALIPIYESEEKWGRLPALYEVLLAQATSDDERLSLLSKLVEVTGSKLNDRAREAQYAKRAYELVPDSEQALALLEESCRAAGSWAPLAEALEARLGSLESQGAPDLQDAERRRLQLTLAGVYGSELMRVDEAVATYRRLLEADPADADAAQALEAILRREGKQEELRWLLELRVTHARFDEDRVRILSEWATLEEEVFEQPPAAAALYQRVLSLADDPVALSALPRLLSAEGDFVGAAQVIERHRDLLAGEERAEREIELAELYLTRLERPVDALEASVRALTQRPGEPRVVRVLERLVELEDTKGRAAEVLATAYAAGGESRREAEALEILLGSTTERTARLELWSRLADVHEEKLSEFGAAFEVMTRAIGEFPAELDLWSRAESLSVLSGRPTELAEAFRLVMQGELEPEVEVELAERAAGLHEDKLGDPLGATPYLERVLRLDPSKHGAFARLKDILTAAERWGELEALYERASAATDDLSRRTDMLVEVALICEEIIEDPAKATKHYEAILELDPVHETALVSLDRLYVASERHEDLARLLEQRLETAVGDEVLELKRRLAALYIDRLHRPDAAVAPIEAVLAEQVNDVEARELAEKLLGIGELRERAARLLEGVYESRNETRDLVRVLAVQLECLKPREGESLSEEQQGARRDLLRRIATLRDEGLREDDGAFEALAELAPLDPADSDTRGRLVEVGRRLGVHARVAEVLTQTAEASDDRDLKGEILMQVAQIQEDLLGEPAQAIATYRAVLELGTDEAHLALPAARALGRLFAAAGQSAELADMLAIQVRLEPDASVQRELLGRLGELAEHTLQDRDRAIGAWRQRLDEDPVDAEALSALDRLYLETERWQELADVLERRAEEESDADARRALRVRRAELLRDRLARPEEAIDAWRQVEDEFGPALDTSSALAALYQGAERWDELGESYQAQLDLVEDPAARLDLLAKLGALRARHLSDVDGALAVYREALTVDSKHAASREALAELLSHESDAARREAAAILRPIHEEEGDSERLLAVLEIEVATADDPLAQLEGLEAALRVADGPLEDPPRAFGYAERAVRAAVGHTDLTPWLAELDRLAAATERQAQHVQLLTEVVPDIFDGDVQLAVTLKIAELSRSQLGDRERAREYYTKALELQSDDRTALVALESLYEEAGDGPELLAILERRVEAARDDEERRALLFRRAQLLAEVLEERDRAIEVYESILDLSLDQTAIARLIDLYTQAARWDSLIELYQRQLDAEPAEAAKLHVAIAEVAARRLSDLPRAFDEVELALESEPSHAGATALLEGWLKEAEDAEHRARAATLLEPVYLRQGDFAKVKDTLAARLDFSQDPDERRELLTRLAQIHEEQEENYPQALETMARLLAEDREDEGTLSELERLAKVASAEGRLAEIYAAQVEEVVTDEGGQRLARRSAELFAELGQRDRALELYRKALAFEPESLALFEALDALLVQGERHEERAELYRAALDHRFEPSDRLAALHVIASLKRGPLGRSSEAIQTYVEALDVEPNDVPALEALTELYQAAERWDELAELYLRRAESEPGASGAGYRLKLAELCQTRLSDTPRAIEQLQEIVMNDPAHSGAIAALEGLLGDPEHKEQVVEILRPLYQEADDWQRQIRLNEERYALATDPAERVEVLRETARLWEARGGDPQRARRAMAAAFELSPDDSDVRLAYQRLTEDTEAWDELAATYRRVLEEHPDLLGARDVLLYLAEVHDKHRDDPRAALNTYERLRELEDGDLEPIQKIEQLATLLSDWDALVRVLVVKADLVFDDEERASIWRRVGESKRDMLEDRAGAIAAYEQAAELEPTSAFTLDQLIELYEGGESPERLVELQLQRVELCDEDDTDLRYELLVAAAKTYEERLNDRPSAIDALTRALEARPGDAEVLRGLGRLYRAEERWPELLDSLKLEASTEEDAAQRVLIRKEIGEILAAQLHSYDEALEAYRLVLEESPDSESTRQAVRKLGEEHEDLRQVVAEILVPVLRGRGAYLELVDVLELRLSVETEPSERSETLQTIAAVFEHNLTQPGPALSAVLRALSETPESTELHADAERLAEASDGFADYAKALEERAGASFDADLVKDLYTRLGEIAERRLADPKRAISAYTRALEQAGELPELLVALSRLYEQVEDHVALADTLERRALASDSADEQAAIYHQLALVQIQKFEEPERGLGSLRQALERVPGHAPSTEALEGLTQHRELFQEVSELLEEVYRAAGRTSDLAKLYEQRVSFAETPGERIELRRGLARVLEEDVGDPAAAQRIIHAALADDPSEASVLAELERLAPITSNWEGAAAALGSAIAAHPELAPDLAKELSLKQAAWYRDRVEDPALAETALIKALEFDPESDEVLLQLDQLQRGEGRERDLIATLRRRARLQLDVSMRELLYQQAKDFADQLEDRALAESLLRELLEQDDANLWALSELTELRERAGDAQETFDLLIRRAELRADAQILRDLRHRAARVAEEQLKDPERAASLYEQLFEDDPTDSAAASALRTLLAQAERWDDLGRLLERLIDLTDATSERSDLRLALAGLARERFGLPDAAIEQLRATLEEEPGRPEAVVLLSELYVETERDEELAELLESQIEAARERGDTDAELTFEVRLGELYETRLSDRAKAIETYRSVLGRSARHPGALTALARLYLADEQPREAAEMLSQLLDDSDGEEACRLSAELADVYEQQSELESAAQALERGLTRGSNPPALRERLAELYTRLEAWDRLAAHLAADAEATEDVDAQVALLVRAADLHAKRRGDLAASAELLERASQLKPDDRELMLALCDAYSASGRAKAAVEVLERIVESYGGKRSKELGDIHRRLATAYLADGDQGRALEELDKAFRIEPGNIHVLKQLGTVSLDAGDLKKAQQMFRALLLQKLDDDSPITKAEVFYNLGRVHHALGEKPKAVQMLERAVQADAELSAAAELLLELKG